MVLSYGVRLVCLVLFSTGLLQITITLLLGLFCSALRHLSTGLSPRWRERACFAVPIASHLVAFAAVLSIIVPQYIRHEVNLASERVGIICVAGALLVAVRYVYALGRAIGLMRRARRLGEPSVIGSVAGIPIRIIQHEHPLLAVTGFFAPRIIGSRRLLNSGTLSEEALEIALAHECAHLRQFDNLKLFLLASLDLPFESASALRRWRRAAEIAADDEAAAGSRQRALLLAETLLAVARTATRRQHIAFALGLLPHEEDLEERIHRLLDEQTADSPPRRQLNPTGVLLLVISATSLLLPLAIAPLHECAEYLLHLG